MSINVPQENHRFASFEQYSSVDIVWVVTIRPTQSTEGDVVLDFQYIAKEPYITTYFVIFISIKIFVVISSSSSSSSSLPSKSKYFDYYYYYYYYHNHYFHHHHHHHHYYNCSVRQCYHVDVNKITQFKYINLHPSRRTE